MNITIISYDNWGFNDQIAIALQNKGHKVNHINFYKFKYKYPNSTYRIYNFFLKMLFGKNLKNQYYGKEIVNQLKANKEIQDVIITIKGDFIAPESIEEFKKYTKKSIAFFNDSIARYPKTVDVLKCFDEVYSFEKKDCEKYGLKFKTNFIYNETTNEKSDYDFQLFNISSRDKRSNLIIKIAASLKKTGFPFKILILDPKNKLKNTDNVEIINKPISLEEVNHFISNSKTLLDIHREKQDGLSFRVFESLGSNKKLITTNSDIKNYDFYNPNNILVLNAGKPEILNTFFKTPYEQVPSHILKKYMAVNWVDEFLN